MPFIISGSSYRDKQANREWTRINANNNRKTDGSLDVWMDDKLVQRMVLVLFACISVHSRFDVDLFGSGYAGLET